MELIGFSTPKICVYQILFLSTPFLTLFFLFLLLIPNLAEINVNYVIDIVKLVLTAEMIFVLGLKLQGELGRFGTTELSDISGFVELPDGKVLSGSEWGNMLLWDGGLIKVEIARKGTLNYLSFFPAKASL